MPTIELVKALKALAAARPTANAGRQRLRDEAQRRVEAELRERARRAMEYVEALSRGELRDYLPDR
jgi:hypothetical protein